MKIRFGILPLDIFRTGRTQAKRNEMQAMILANETAAQRVATEARARREQSKLNKLAVRSLRSKRSAGFFGGETSATLG